MADDRDEPIRRVVPADSAPPVGRSGSPFEVLSQFGLAAEPQERPKAHRRAGKKAKEPSATRANGVQFQVACVLLTAGAEGMHRDAIADKLEGVTVKVLSTALANMKSAGRTARIGGTRWALTEKGRDWATGGANLMNQRRSVTTTPPQLVPVRPSFRCWIDSNGTFAMEKAGQKVELELEETRQMLRYLDAVGEELIAAAQINAIREAA